MSAEDSNAHDDSENVTEIARKLVAHGGGAASVDLAFDIVLHDLVQQVRTATGAAGAAIALIREGELVCRATTGENAPDLGVRVESSSGLVGDCLREGTVQRCADTEQDPRVNADACRRLGVRSMLVAPILDGKSVDGVLQLFSSSPDAFGVDAMNRLPLFTQRIAESKREMDSAIAFVANGELNKDPGSEPGIGPAPEIENPVVDDVATDRIPSEMWSAILVALIIAAAIGLGFLIGWRGKQREQVKDVRPKAPLTMPNARDATGGGEVTAAQNAIDAQRSTSAKANTAVPNGGLIITENGKVVYRSSEGNSNVASRDREPVRLTHRVDPEYPPLARAQGIQGQVVLDIQVLGSGDVGKLDVISGDPQLAQAAIQAVKQWKYRPSNSDAERQERVTIRFVLPAN